MHDVDVEGEDGDKIDTDEIDNEIDNDATGDDDDTDNLEIDVGVENIYHDETDRWW